MIAIVIGTRPELTKMAPILRKLKEENLPYIFIHSNQHYSKELDEKIMSDLQIDTPHYNLNVGSASHAVQTGQVMAGAEAIFVDMKPDFVLVHGDTNTTLAAAVAAKKLNIPVGHIEAGLRSFDQRMPEEINRILIDRISDLLFAPTEVAKKNLQNDGLAGEKVLVTGNTFVDALQQHVVLSDASNILTEMDLEKDGYILVTAHRPENVDSEENLSNLIVLLDYASTKLGKKIIFPAHPRTASNIKKFGIDISENIILTSPVGYIDMLALLKNTSLIMTDSGGLQEEAYVLKKPLITLRTSTERPETLTANFIIGTSIDEFDTAWEAFENKTPYWEDSFGDGNASSKIIERIKSYIHHG
jgi:UDP-N-acetylglucosamine 2-epimerase (non-hydrolysing)